MLPSFNGLLSLNLSGTDMYDSGLDILLRGLTSPHCKIRNLYLDENNISDKGAFALAAVLPSYSFRPECVTLRGNNRLTDKGIRHLKETVRLTRIRRTVVASRNSD